MIKNIYKPFLLSLILIMFLFAGTLSVFAEADLTINSSDNFSGVANTPIDIDDIVLSGTPDGDVSVKLLVSEGSLEMTTTTGLTFTGPSTGDVLFFSGSFTDINNALATLQYTRASVGTDTLEVSLVEPGEVFFADNGHLYEYITDAGDWNAAKTKAEALTRYGATGYLTTILSQDENDFVNDRLEDAGWMGASDVASEGDWKWVTGPETGTSFWSGDENGSAVGGNYENWNTGEPNDSSGNEDCGQFLSGGSGVWNDLPCSGSSLPGYVAEFGAPGDLPDVEAKDITITTSTVPVILTLDPVDNTTAASTVGDLVITFDQAIDVQSGNISLYTADDDQLVEVIDVAGGPVSGAGTDTITIDFIEDLDFLTSYYVLIDATVFRNLFGVEFPGVLDTTTWNFTTLGLGSGSGAIGYTPTNPVIADEEDSVMITFTLDEPIISGEADPEVVITLRNPRPDILDFDTTTLTWTELQWNESRTLTITPDEAFTFTENINTIIEFTAVSESEYYDGRSSAIPLLIGAVGIDAPIPIQSLLESAESPTVDILSFTLESRPTGDVTITPISSEGQVMFDPASATFTFENWDQSQSIISTAIDDDEYEGTHYDMVSFLVTSDDSNYDGFTLTDVPVTILDDDPQPRSRSSSTAQSKKIAQEAFNKYYNQTTETSSGNEGGESNSNQTNTCSANQIITQNLKAPSRNGVYNSYTGGIVTEATILQAHLNRLGFNSGPEDGIIGPLTDGAIKRMQTFLGTTPDGYVGPITRGLMNNSCGSQGLQS